MANKETYAQWSRPGKLKKAIDDDAGITTAVDWIETNESPNTDIHFVAAIGAGEKTALDTLMGSHAAPTKNYLSLSSDAALDDDQKVPKVAADDTAKHTITIQKKDENGTNITTGTETLRVTADVPVKISDTTPTLAAGTVTFEVGPSPINREVTVTVEDPDQVLQARSIVLRFHSDTPSKRTEAMVSIPMGSMGTTGGGSPKDYATTLTTFDLVNRCIIDFGKLASIGSISGNMYIQTHNNGGSSGGSTIRVYNETDATELGSITRNVWGESSHTIVTFALSSIPASGIKSITLEGKINSGASTLKIAMGTIEFTCSVED